MSIRVNETVREKDRKTKRWVIRGTLDLDHSPLDDSDVLTSDKLGLAYMEYFSLLDVDDIKPHLLVGGHGVALIKAKPKKTKKKSDDDSASEKKPKKSKSVSLNNVEFKAIGR